MKLTVDAFGRAKAFMQDSARPLERADLAYSANCRLRGTLKKELDNYTDANRRAWNQAAPVHRSRARFQELLDGFGQPGYSCLDHVETDRLRTPALSREPPCPSLTSTGQGPGCRMGL